MKFLIFLQFLLAAGVIYVVFLTDNSASDLNTTNSFKLVIKNPDSDYRPDEPKPPVKPDEEPKTPPTTEPKTPEKPPVKPEEPTKEPPKEPTKQPSKEPVKTPEEPPKKTSRARN